VFALLLVAVSLGISNFAAAVGLGVTGVRAVTRLRVGVVFGVFEAGMPVLGLAAGRGLAVTLGHAARWTGAALLIAAGAYAVAQSLRAGRGSGVAGTRPADGPAAESTARMLVSGLALSIDNLVIGFALGTYHVSVAVAAAVIGGVSVAMSLAGLELGARLGRPVGRHGELVGGLVLVVVGAAIGAGVL
jgi:manganese efflux pump family protein